MTDKPKYFNCEYKYNRAFSTVWGRKIKRNKDTSFGDYSFVHDSPFCFYLTENLNLIGGFLVK